MRGVVGLVFLGFPLHPVDKPSIERASHLSRVTVPMLFVQGDRDKLAEFPRMESVVSGLGSRSTLLRIAHADHGFDVLVKSGRTPGDVTEQLLNGVAAWIARTVESYRPDRDREEVAS